MSTASEPAAPLGAFQIRNVRLFVAFRLLYHARFYYPIFTILFLDYGLTLEQFALLNVVWSVTIVLAEVPSGALADLVGRRTLVVAAGFLVLVELGTIALVPTGDPDVVFWAFLVNRICSGLAEASASGADEALAYDSLAAEGDPGEWSAVLERLGRLSALVFFVAMISGALVYDPAVVNRVAGWLGVERTFAKSDLLRIPVYLSLVTGACAFAVALRLKEVGEPREAIGLGAIRQAFRQILDALRWTLSARFVLFVILGGLILDSVARQFVLLVSEYFRQISIPTALFGPVMAGMALLGVVTSKLGRVMADRFSPLRNLLILSAMQLIGLGGAALAIPYWGVLFTPFLFMQMSLVGFLQSHYLNAQTDSKRRATVLSLKGLALNLGLGLVSLLYAGLVHHLERGGAEEPFVAALAWGPPYYLVLLVALLLAGRLMIRERSLCTEACAASPAGVRAPPPAEARLADPPES